MESFGKDLVIYFFILYWVSILAFSCVYKIVHAIMFRLTDDLLPTDQRYLVKTYVCFWFYSLNWQHQLCKNPRPNPDIKTLFTDHSCNPTSNGARPPPPTNNPLVGPIPKAGQFPPIGAHGVSILHLSAIQNT